MANNKPLRIFFGFFQRIGGSDYATDIGGYDALYPWFITGGEPSPGQRVHNRRPIDMTNGHIVTWDEYLDLHMASAEIAKAGELYTFKDTMGVEDVLVWQPNSNFQFIPGNVLKVETYLNEFFFPTKRLTQPDPTATTTPSLRWTPDLVLAAAGAVDSQHEIWIYTTLGGTDSTPVKITVNKFTGSDELAFWIKDGFGTPLTITISRADLEVHSIHGERIWSDYPRAVTGCIAYDLDIGIDPQITVTAQSGGWYKVVIADFFTRVYTAGAIPVLAAYNNAIHRVAFDYERRHRIDAAAPYSLTQTWLVLDAETNKYYKGILEAVSPAFLVGVSKRTEDTGQLIIRILEEGMFMPAAWVDPTTPGNFLAWTR